jgi:hypothetical protein
MAPFIASPTQQRRTHWTPPSPAVGKMTRHYDTFFTTGEDARLQITFVARRIISVVIKLAELPNGCQSGSSS